MFEAHTLRSDVYIVSQYIQKIKNGNEVLFRFHFLGGGSTTDGFLGK